MMSRHPRGPARRHLVGANARGHRSEQDMADINVDEIGPVDYLVVGFPADRANFSGDGIRAEDADRQQHHPGA